MVTSRKFLFNFFLIILACTYLEAVVITVNSDLDDPAINPTVSPLTATGITTLRSAIQYANSVGGSNEINFDITGTAPFTISVGTGSGIAGESLPAITSKVIINGYTQPGASVATTSVCPPVLVVAKILIVLDGHMVTTGTLQDGLTLLNGSDSSVIQGLVIQNFPNSGITIQGGTGQRIVGNYIGVDQTGSFSMPNAGNGITIGSGVTGVIIGSLATADRNIISGQNDLTGATPVSGVGIFTEGSAGEIVGNFIGTDATGTNSIPNRTGIYILNPLSAKPLGNTITCNTIQNNNGTGEVEGFGVIISGAFDNPILSNSIFNNTQSAVIFINDGNNNLPAPVLTSAIASGPTIKVNGTLSSPNNPNSTFRIEFFVNSTSRDMTTEGQTYVGQAIIVTDGSGNAAFNNIRLPSNANPGQFVSATATLLDSSGIVETSQYSTDVTLAQGSFEGTISLGIYTKYCNRNDMPCNATT